MKFWHRFSRSLSFQSFFWVMTVRWGQRKGFKEAVSATKDRQYQHCNNSGHLKTWTTCILQVICNIQQPQKVFQHLLALKTKTLVRLDLILNIIYTFTFKNPPNVFYLFIWKVFFLLLKKRKKDLTSIWIVYSIFYYSVPFFLINNTGFVIPFYEALTFIYL